jgi:dTDP-4-amino-4,6-dideoxygalactose transaminase
MIKLADFNNPFDAITKFESEVCKYTGAPYAVSVDSCTHAIELAFRATSILSVQLPANTYISVPMTLMNLNVHHEYITDDWYSELEYNFRGSNIWDSARKFQKNMYRTGQIQCLSFGYSKPLEIGRGGAILTDNESLANTLRLLRYDGRDLNISPWCDQRKFKLGFHYAMKPEECVVGINKLLRNEVHETQSFEYPDLRSITIER